MDVRRRAFQEGGANRSNGPLIRESLAYSIDILKKVVQGFPGSPVASKAAMLPKGGEVGLDPSVQN